MDVIKSVKDLPDWFKETKYEKNLDAIDWYREIRKRQYGLDAINFVLQRPSVTCHHAKELFDIFYMSMKKDWVLYTLPQSNYPIEDMTKMEAMYIAACFDNERSQEAYRDYQALIETFRGEVNHPDRTTFSRKYEDMLGAFFDKYSKDDEPMGEFVYSTVADTVIGNLYLSYGRPLKGYPVIIDTQYDDETILGFVREWLAQRREENGEKPIRRPFTQNDFDDWAYYRIREAIDLDTWARVNDVKILDKVMAAALWPNATDEISPIDILRTTTRKKAKEIFQLDVCIRLYGQLRIELGENFLAE